MAVFAPIPRPSDTTATTDSTGAARRARQASRRSCIPLVLLRVESCGNRVEKMIERFCIVELDTRVRSVDG